jgi:hypothetical protein
MGQRFFLARKALELALQEDVDSDSDADDKFLNLEDNEGIAVIVWFFSALPDVWFLGDVWDQDSAYLELLAKEGARLRQEAEKNDGFEDSTAGDEDDEEDSDDEVDEELGYISPLDTVDPYITFKQALTGTSIVLSLLTRKVPDVCYSFPSPKSADVSTWDYSFEY